MIESYSDYIHTKKLDLNLSKIKNSAHKMYNFVKNEFVENCDHNGQSSMVDQIFAKYNAFMYPYPEFYELFKQIQIMFQDLISTDSSDYSDDPHYLQSWVNFYRKGDFISWHGHWPVEVNAWHGYYCVDVEPSKTTYQIPNVKGNIDVINSNNLLIISKSDGDRHRTWPWEYDRPRITIAFDIVPACHIMSGHPGIDTHNRMGKNHWIPV